MSEELPQGQTGMRAAISRAVTHGWQVPRVAMGVSVEVDSLLRRADVVGQHANVKITPTHCVIFVISRLIKQHPMLNGSLQNGKVSFDTRVHINVAVQTNRGLFAPIIRDTQEKSMEEIAAELSILAATARAGRLSAAAQERGTFTVSSLGGTGIDWFTPILSPPQLCTIGIGSATDRAVVHGGAVTAAKVMDLALIFDHRAVDGQPAAIFLNALRQDLEAFSSLD